MSTVDLHIFRAHTTPKPISGSAPTCGSMQQTNCRRVASRFHTVHNPNTLLGPFHVRMASCVMLLWMWRNQGTFPGTEFVLLYARCADHPQAWFRSTSLAK